MGELRAFPSTTIRDMTNTTLINDWITSLSARRLSPSTLRLRRYYVEKLATYGHLLSATLQDLQAVLATLSDAAPETMKSVRSSWRSFYQWARRAGHLDHDPSEDLLPIRIPRTVPHIAPDSAIAAAIQQAPLRERAILQLARLACLRLNEVTTLHTDDRRGEWLYVTGKGNKQRRIYVHPDLAASLNELERTQGRGHYFPGGTQGHLHRETVYKLIVRSCGHNPHSLRHAGATAAYNATRDLRAVQEMLGHSSMAVTQRYLHIDDAGLKAAALGTALAA